MKIMFVSLGCDKNLVDTENMLGILRNRGFEFTDDEYEADVIAVNTCCFIHDAKQESIDTILEMAEHKKDGKCKALIVSGCLAHRYHDEIEKEIPEVDALLGTASYDKIAEVVLSVLEGKGYRCIDDADRLVMTKDERIITTGGYYEYFGHLYRKIKRKILDAGRRRIQQAFKKLLFSEHCRAERSAASR